MEVMGFSLGFYLYKQRNGDKNQNYIYVASGIQAQNSTVL